MMSDDDWDDGEADEDWPDDDGSDDDGHDDGASLTVSCPACKADIYEDAEQCPYCGEYVVRSSNIWNGKPVWWIVVGGLGIIATVFALTVI